MLNLQEFSKYLAAYQIQIPRLIETAQVTDFSSSLPEQLRSSSNQITSEVQQHGYEPYKFISLSKYGFVFSAKKGNIRYSIKACKNVIQQNNKQVNLVKKNREYPAGLQFYQHPNVLSLIESFETVDYHYTVTEECIMTLRTFVSQVNFNNDDSKYVATFLKYQREIYSSLDFFTKGPYAENSSRFISHINPDDVLISYTTQIKINPNFGQPDKNIGAIPFIELSYSIAREQVPAYTRMRKSYAHLLLFLLGKSEQEILLAEIGLGKDENTSLNKIMSEIISSSKENVRDEKESRYENNKQYVSQIYDSNDSQYLPFQSGVYHFLNLQLEKLGQLTPEASNNSYIGIGKREFISLSTYTELYSLSKQTFTEDQRNDFFDALESKIEQRQKRQKIFSGLKKCWLDINDIPIIPRTIQRDYHQSAQKTLKFVANWEYKFDGLTQLLEKKITNTKNKRNKTENQEQEQPQQTEEVEQRGVRSRQVSQEIQNERKRSIVGIRSPSPANSQDSSRGRKSSLVHPNSSSRKQSLSSGSLDSTKAPEKKSTMIKAPGVNIPRFNKRDSEDSLSSSSSNNSTKL